MIRIGIISANDAMKWLKQIENNLPENVELTYLVYQNLEHLKELYENNYFHFDGIAFSGELPYFYIKQSIGFKEVPSIYFDVLERDFYKVLTKLFHDNKNFCLKRTFIDFVFTENHFLGLKEWLNEDEFPYFFREHLMDYVTDTIYDEIFEHHLSLWENKQIDLSLTRFSSIPSKLSQCGVNHIMVNPSLESMHEKIQSLLEAIEVKNLIDNQVVFGNISFYHPGNKDFHEMEYHHIALYKAILDYSKQKNMPFIIHRDLVNYEIITTFKDLRMITDDLSTCDLLAFFKKNLNFPVHIGWGIGHSIQEARNNALQARVEKTDWNDSVSFVMTKEEELIGPLGDIEKALTISNSLDKNIEKLSEKYHMSSLQIRRILAVMDKIQSNELVADDLAIHLGITVRAATRILSKLEENGVAEVSHKKQKKLKGRPKKSYKIQFFKDGM
nr:transcriptional regulator [Neobacillus sp. Marseille-Q6967]